MFRDDNLAGWPTNEIRNHRLILERLETLNTTTMFTLRVAF